MELEEEEEEEELEEEEEVKLEEEEEGLEGAKRCKSSIGPDLLSSLIALAKCSSHSGMTHSSYILSISSVPSKEVGIK